MRMSRELTTNLKRKQFVLWNKNSFKTNQTLSGAQRCECPMGEVPSKQAYSNEEKGVRDILLNIQIVILL